MMTITHVASRSTGFIMPDRDVPAEKSNHGRFVSVREFSRSQPLHTRVPLATLDFDTAARNLKVLLMGKRKQPRIHAALAALQSS